MIVETKRLDYFKTLAQDLRKNAGHKRFWGIGAFDNHRTVQNIVSRTNGMIYLDDEMKCGAEPSLLFANTPEDTHALARVLLDKRDYAIILPIEGNLPGRQDWDAFEAAKMFGCFLSFTDRTLLGTAGRVQTCDQGEASAFAMELLMPENWFLPLAKKHHNDTRALAAAVGTRPSIVKSRLYTLKNERA